MKKIAKNVIISLLLLAIACGVMCSCSNTSQYTEESYQSSKAASSVHAKDSVKIPDIEKLDVTTAKTLLAGKGLIPKVEYEYHNDYDYDLIIRTEPAIGSEVEEDTPVTLYVCKGPSYHKIEDAVGWIQDVNNIDNFVWAKEASDGIGTKWFYNLYAKEGYLYITVGLKCTSKYSIKFYGDFGTASISDTFDKTVPIKLIYDSAVVNNSGETTEFELKIPLTDLGVQKPTNIYVDFDFLVNEKRETFKAGFNLTW